MLIDFLALDKKNIIPFDDIIFTFPLSLFSSWHSAAGQDAGTCVKREQLKIIIVIQSVGSRLVGHVFCLLLLFRPAHVFSHWRNHAPGLSLVWFARVIEAFMCFGNGESVVVCPVHERHHRH